MTCPRRFIERWFGRTEVQWGWNFSYKIYPSEEFMYLIVSFLFVTFYIPMWKNKHNYQYSIEYSWGVYWFESSLWFNWGKKVKSFDAPWHWKHVRHQIMYPEGLLDPKKESWDKEDGRIMEVFPYTYTKKNGVVQERRATVSIDEREWRWKWFTWLPWPSKIQRCIDFDFDSEVGERSGSWKGGCMASGYEMLPGETMEQTLRRMEVERKF